MSIKRNFLYNSILTVSGYVFTFATYPYVSRVLGLTNVGVVNFVDGIINYFILFAMMGISTVGIREVATNKTNKAKLSKTFSSIILLNAISTLIAIAILLTAMYTIPQLYPHRQLLYIGIWMKRLGFDPLITVCSPCRMVLYRFGELLIHHQTNHYHQVRICGQRFPFHTRLFRLPDILYSLRTDRVDQRIG